MCVSPARHFARFPVRSTSTTLRCHQSARRSRRVRLGGWKDIQTAMGTQLTVAALVGPIPRQPGRSGFEEETCLSAAGTIAGVDSASSGLFREECVSGVVNRDQRGSGTERYEKVLDVCGRSDDVGGGLQDQCRLGPPIHHDSTSAVWPAAIWAMATARCQQSIPDGGTLLAGARTRR